MKFKPHHVAITVNNIEESIKWYEEKLGFKARKRYDMYGGKKAILERDDVRLELFDFLKENKPLPDYSKDLMDDLHVIGTKHLGIEVENLTEIVAMLKAKGVESMKIKEAGFGGKFTFIKDCNGILIELYQR